MQSIFNTALVKIHKGPTFHGKKRFDEEFGWENSDVLSVLLQMHNKCPSKPSKTHFSAPFLVENKYFSCCHMENISSAETFQIPILHQIFKTVFTATHQHIFWLSSTIKIRHLNLSLEVHGYFIASFQKCLGQQCPVKGASLILQQMVEHHVVIQEWLVRCDEDLTYVEGRDL